MEMVDVVALADGVQDDVVRLDDVVVAQVDIDDDVMVVVVYFYDHHVIHHTLMQHDRNLGFLLLYHLDVKTLQRQHQYYKLIGLVQLTRRLLFFEHSF